MPGRRVLSPVLSADASPRPFSILQRTANRARRSFGWASVLDPTTFQTPHISHLSLVRPFPALCSMKIQPMELPLTNPRHSAAGRFFLLVGFLAADQGRTSLAC